MIEESCSRLHFVHVPGGGGGVRVEISAVGHVVVGELERRHDRVGHHCRWEERHLIAEAVTLVVRTPVGDIPRQLAAVGAVVVADDVGRLGGDRPVVAPRVADDVIAGR